MNERTQIKNTMKMDTMINEIIYISEKYFNIKPGEIHLRSRKQEILQVRQVAHYFAYKYTKLSYTEIGKKIGNKQRGTVMNSINKINNRIDCHPYHKKTINIIDIIIKDKKNVLALKRRSRLLVKIIKEFYPNHEIFFKYKTLLNENN